MYTIDDVQPVRISYRHHVVKTLTSKRNVTQNILVTLLQLCLTQYYLDSYETNIEPSLEKTIGKTSGWRVLRWLVKRRYVTKFGQHYGQLILRWRVKDRHSMICWLISYVTLTIYVRMKRFCQYSTTKARETTPQYQLWPDQSADPPFKFNICTCYTLLTRKRRQLYALLMHKGRYTTDHLKNEATLSVQYYSGAWSDTTV